MLDKLNEYDWAEVFGEGNGGNCTAVEPRRIPGEACSLESFGREDVAEIRGIEEGENDGLDWIVWGILKDGRFFIATGGCDYTGWDCQASNTGNVAETEDSLIRFAMSDDERHRFGIAEPPCK